MKPEDIIEAHMLANAEWDMETVALVARCDLAWLLRRVAEGLIDDAGTDAAALQRIARMHRCERDFEASPELAALVADLLAEVDALRLRLRRAGLD